jgi:hypothetical protein
MQCEPKRGRRAVRHGPRVPLRRRVEVRHLEHSRTELNRGDVAAVRMHAARGAPAAVVGDRHDFTVVANTSSYPEAVVEEHGDCAAARQLARA